MTDPQAAAIRQVIAEMREKSRYTDDRGQWAPITREDIGVLARRLEAALVADLRAGEAQR